MYIGVTIDPERRWSQHRRMNTQCSALKSAFKKYGVGSFTFTVLVCGEDRYIDALEIKAIENLNTLSPNGYNITLGGDGAVKVKWEEEWNHLLGTKSDRELAKDLGVSTDVVSHRRNGAGIKSNHEQKMEDRWGEWEHLLGTKSDKDIAKESGIPHCTVHNRRVKLNIPVYKRPDPFTKEIISLLGEVSDRKLSNTYDISLDRIRAKRKELGIPHMEIGSWVNGRDWSEEELSYIRNTELTTQQVSDNINVSRVTVQKKRKELGIKYNRVGKMSKNHLTPTIIEELLNKDIRNAYFKSKYGMSICAVTKSRKEAIKLREKKDNDEEKH